MLHRAKAKRNTLSIALWKLQNFIFFAHEKREISTNQNRSKRIVIQAIFLTLSWRRFLFYRNQSIDLHSKSMNCFLYNKDLRHKS